MLLPADTDVGEATLVTIRSASVAVATISAAVAVLFVVFGSLVAELTVTVSLIAVPAGVPAVTLRITGKLADPTAKLGLVQLIVPALPTVGRVQDHPLGIGVNETKVVFAGVTSVKVAVLAALGPPLVNTCVYVMLFPACTGTGLAELVTERAAELATSTLEEAELLPVLGSPVAEKTDAVSAITVPGATVVATLTTKVNVAVPTGRLAMLQV